MGLILQPDKGTRLAIIPVPIRTVIMLPPGGIIPIRFFMALIIMPRGRFRPAGTTRLRRPGLIPILGDISDSRNILAGSGQVHLTLAGLYLPTYLGFRPKGLHKKTSVQQSIKG